MGNPTAKPLVKRLEAGQDADSEFDRLIGVFLARMAVEGKATGGERHPRPFSPHLWSMDRVLCLVRPPSIRDPERLERLLASVRETPLGESRGSEGWERFILAIPEAAPCSFSHGRGPCRRCLDRLPKQLRRIRSVEHWDEPRLRDMIRELAPLALRYYPEDVPQGPERIKEYRKQRTEYLREMKKLWGRIQFVGMSVYKEEASSSVPIENIYIPLKVVPEASAEDKESEKTDPLGFLEPRGRHVILGDPGSGKSTLLRFLALAGAHKGLQEKYGAKEDFRLPLLIILRRYAAELREHPDLGLLDYVLDTARVDFNMPDLQRDFFEYYLYGGEAVVLIDGIDELPDPGVKARVRDQVDDLLARYPGNTVILSSRIVGYDTETRYDAMGFLHHRVARLAMEDVTRFVKDWYAARIENEAERRRHAGDLVHIVSDEDNRAIRDLAENPLLLTIMCLVHRVDAVLPDERVVLYQKCTETLLNTWHTWKYHGEQTRNRNKTERRNRARMEAIAYWMHCKLGEDPGGGRAVVPYAELRDFLGEYIGTIEKPRTEKALRAAELFLRFVRDRAGLLIEAGEDLYSFVHLTFQEYLAATHLRKSGEKGGMAVVWDFIEGKCGDPRWREPIRLLLGSLERTDAQEYLLERIIPSGEEEEEDFLPRSLLAAGCLIDGIDAAEEMREEIVFALLVEAARVGEIESLREALRLLSTWMGREPENRDLLLELTKSACESFGEDEAQLGLSLNLLSLGFGSEELREVSGTFFDLNTREGRIAAASGLVEYGAKACSLQPDDVKALNTMIAAFGSTGHGANFAAAVYTALVPTQSRGAACPRFTQILALLGTLLLAPFLFYVEHAIRIAPRSGEESLTRRVYRVTDLGWDLAEARVRLPVEPRDLVQARVQGLERARALEGTDLSDPEIADPVLAPLCTALRLAPVAHWMEALRLGALPDAPERFTLVDPELWRRTRKAVEEGRRTDSDLEHAACQLLLDVWLWTAGYYDEPEESPFDKVAQLTRDIDHPYLRVAHAIRDIAHGNKARIEDLKGLVRSEEPAYRCLFVEAFWRYPEPETRES